MKKFLVLFLAVFSLSSLADYKLISFRRHFIDSAGSVGHSNTSFSHLGISNDFDSVIFPIVYNNSVYFKVNTATKFITSPSQVFTLNSSSSSLSVDRPIIVSSNDVSYCAPLCCFAPKTYSLYLFCNAYYRSNPESLSFTSYSGGLVAFNPRQVLQEILFSTNSVLVSSFLSELSGINNSVSSLSPVLSNISSYVDENGYMLSDILDILSGYVGPLKSKPFTEQIDAYSKLSNSYVGGLAPSQLQYIKDTYNSLADTDILAATRYADSVLSGLRQASDIIGFNQAVKDFGLAANTALFDLGSEYNKGLENSVNQGFNASFSVQGATTNLLQRMTNDTAHIKQQLADGRVAITNQLERQWDGIKKIEQHTGDSASTLDTIKRNGVKIDTSGSAVPVVIQSGSQTPVFVNIDAEDLNFLATTINEGSSSLWATWLNTWRDWNASEQNFRNRQRDYMVNLNTYIHSNYLHSASIDRKLDFGFTNIFDSIYFALTNLDLAASTNSYMLLSDYADYISSSGLSDLLDILDDDSYSDLKGELFSFGAVDVSEGYGRWWRYFTGLSTIQANSVFKISNLLVAHENLLKELKRDNTDVVELSDANVFSELLSKIPSQTHIDNKISELTNSIDQSGFVRIGELIPDLTNRLSLASALYDHDFALPTDISWVLIPGDAKLNVKERVVHISPSEHYRVFQVLHYGIAFSYCIVNLILLPKFLLLLVRLFDRVWNKSEHLIYNSTQS